MVFVRCLFHYKMDIELSFLCRPISYPSLFHLLTRLFSHQKYKKKKRLLSLLCLCLHVFLFACGLSIPTHQLYWIADLFWSLPGKNEKGGSREKWERKRWKTSKYHFVRTRTKTNIKTSSTQTLQRWCTGKENKLSLRRKCNIKNSFNI